MCSAHRPTNGADSEPLTQPWRVLMEDADEGRHTSPDAATPCRDGFPAGPTGCANPDLHHLYRLPASYLATEPVEQDVPA